MGSYANWDDVASRYPKIESVVSADEIGPSFIEGVEAVMNSYLVKIHTVPVGGEPPLLKDVCVDLVYAKIAVHKDKAVKTIRDNAMAVLKNIVTGDVLLVDNSGGIIESVGQAVWSSTEDHIDSFSMLGAKFDRIDPDLIEDLIDERT